MKTILVVDDDSAILEAISLSLEYEGYTVDTASGGDEAMHKISQKQPSLIILDVLLSGSDGRTIVRSLKANPVTMKIPVIMISAHPNVMQTVLDAGADSFLAKPFNINEMISLIGQYTIG